MELGALVRIRVFDTGNFPDSKGGFLAFSKKKAMEWLPNGRADDQKHGRPSRHRPGYGDRFAVEPLGT